MHPFLRMRNALLVGFCALALSAIVAGAAEAKPIGNGPVKFVSRTPNALIKMERFDDYKGEDKVHFKTLDVKIYSSQETAYQDLVAGKLDFMEALPPSAKVGEKVTWKVIGGHTLSFDVPEYLPILEFKPDGSVDFICLAASCHLALIPVTADSAFGSAPTVSGTISSRRASTSQ